MYVEWLVEFDTVRLTFVSVKLIQQNLQVNVMSCLTKRSEARSTSKRSIEHALLFTGLVVLDYAVSKEH